MEEVELGLTLIESRGRRYPTISICDLDFADDIVLLSNEIEQAKKLLQSVETECGKVGLGINAKKTKGMVFNQPNVNLQKTIKIQQNLRKTLGIFA